MVGEFLEGGQPLAFDARTTDLSWQSRWSGFIERGVHAQSGDEGDGAGHGLTEGERVEGSVTAVGDHYHRAVENVMISCKARVVAEAHDAEG